MTDSRTIEKKDRPSEVGFDALRKAGIGYAQQLSGRHWSDYNLHDPGVTLLEQLCYALTDLVYRADFAVADHLTDKDGRIDYAQLALYPPEAILPSRPTTLNDYRKIVFDAVRELDNVWFSPAQGRFQGLYEVTLRLKEDVAPAKRQAVIDQVRAIYSRNRNLCEDIAAVTVVRDVECELHAQVEISDATAAANTLARIYHECAKLITAGIRLHSYEEQVKSGKSLEEILTGPFCTHGYIEESELVDNAQEVLITDLFAAVNVVESVARIHHLHLEVDGKVCANSLRSRTRGTALRLRIPQSVEDIKVQLLKDGFPVAVSIKAFTADYEELNFSRKTRIHRLEEVAALFAPPRGHYREPGIYTSIQNELPPIYGTNAYGVPASAAPETKARVKQLKGYLLLFEQLIANHRGGLHALRELFSPESGTPRSYVYEVLTKESIADLEAVYPADAEQALNAIVSKYDDYADRKGRLLDYLLALYGESLSQEALVHFNFYYTQNELKTELIRNKVYFLRLLAVIERDRAGAYDYHRPVWNGANVAGLQRKLSILLGFKHHYQRSLTRAFVRYGLKVVSDASFSGQEEGVDPKRVETADSEQSAQIKLHPVHLDAGESARPGMRRHDIAEPPFLAEGVISETLLTEGVDIDAYKVAYLGAACGCRLLLKARQADRWLHLGTHPDRDRAATAANRLRRFLIRLNLASEGLHLLEHILLRPEVESGAHVGNGANEQDFYSFRISIVFPAWSRRCRDANFRALAEETVRRECPAHLFADVHWLDFAAYDEFEALYRSWLDHKASHGEDVETSRAAQRLARFLLNARAKK